MLTQQALDILKQAGWSESRSIDTTQDEARLKAKGYPVHPAVKDFLSSFGGIRCRNPRAVPPAAEDWHFVIDEAVRNIAPERVQSYYSRRVGLPLCLIGEGFQGYMALMMDADGQVYGAYDEELYRIGSSGEDAIQALCEGRDFQPLGG